MADLKTQPTTESVDLFLSQMKSVEKMDGLRVDR